MSARWILTALLFIVACGGPAVRPAAGPEGGLELHGTVTYRARVALPEDAVVEVVFADGSRADAPMTVLGRDEIRTGGRQVPIPFAVTVDSALAASHRYQARATIRSGGRLLFTSTTAHVVDPDVWPDSLEIQVEQVP